jgi:hypothetical protein
MRGKGLPLQAGPIIGLAYCLTGVAVGIGADAIGGWPSAPLWVLAVLLVAAGLWTTFFTGLVWGLLRWVSKRSAKPQDGRPRANDPRRPGSAD